MADGREAQRTVISDAKRNGGQLVSTASRNGYLTLERFWSAGLPVSVVQPVDRSQTVGRQGIWRSNRNSSSGESSSTIVVIAWPQPHMQTKPSAPIQCARRADGGMFHSSPAVGLRADRGRAL